MKTLKTLKTLKKVLWILLVGLPLPLPALATGRHIDRVEIRTVEKHRTNRDAVLVGLLIGAVVTVTVYESQKKDKRVAFVPTNEGAGLRYQARF